MDLQYLAYQRQERNQFVMKMTEEIALTKKQKQTIEIFLIAYDSLFNKFLDNKDLVDFSERVQNMRTAQSKYFASRTQVNLDASKTLERKIDNEVKETMKKAKRVKTVQAAFVFDEPTGERV